MSDRLPYSWLEREQRETADDLLAGGIYGVDQVTEALARTMAPLTVPPVDARSTPPDYWIKSALLHIAAIGIRSARAATILVQHGYAPESLAPLRVLHESVDHLRWVLANPQGDNACNWLTDERRRRLTASGVARRSGSQPVFDLLGNHLHVTQRAAQTFREQMDESRRFPIMVGPTHREQESGAILFAIQGKLVEMCDLLREAWNNSDEDPALQNIRIARRVDESRHDTIETLLSPGPNPFRNTATPGGSFI